jgi:DNA-binding XRE family transcriptional regulator
MLKPEQCRAGRALLDWTQSELAAQVPISAVSIRAFEKGGEMRVSNQRLLRKAFEAAGVVFIDENGGGAGARLAVPFGM